ncbi:LamG domain-containing protein [Flavivirga spongiicola]|uniref:LamG domain-containing protein n=1 Tax=Flavivirga spongiicola TaxID=421621 RepID=A0ABU7XNG7_9FLAO|nr:LamG domain-containing protein [Flavivirga sp. MEBiC05379]MDO5977303.1 LamG domain-containing protein [Flavivirga sp. MEBiC05379]
MKFKIKFILILLLGGIFLNGCDEVEVVKLEFSDSSFKEVRMYLRELKDDHTSRKDLTISSTIDKTARTVAIVIKYDADITNLYGIATIERGAMVNPVGGAPGFGTVGDYSTPHKYTIESPDGGSVEWTVTVTLADPPPPVVGPTGFELIRQSGESKHIAVETFPSRDLESFIGNLLGFNYNGTDQYAVVNDDDDIKFRYESDYSISFWVRTTSTDSDPVMIGDQNWASSNNPGMTIAFRGDNWRVAVSDGGSKADAATSGVPFNDGNWHLLSVTFDRDGNMTMYQDGSPVQSASMVGVGSIDSGNPLNISQDGESDYGQFFDGDIVEAKIYDYVLTPQEVTDLSKAQTGASLRSKNGLDLNLDVTTSGGAVLTTFDNKYIGYDLDGSSQYITIDDGGALDFRYASDYSISFWMNTTSTDSDPVMVGDQDWGSSGNPGITIAFRGTNWRVATNSDGGTKADTSAGDSPTNDGNWHMLTVTLDRDANMILYQDGEPISSADMSGVGDTDHGAPLRIGQDGTGGYGQFFQGKIANVEIHDIALNETEVKNLFEL